MGARRQRIPIRAAEKAPDFRLPLLDAGETSLQDIVSAAPALRVFFKVSCPVCQLTLPFLDRIRSTGRLPIYAVSQNDAAETRDFNREFRLSLPTLLDPEEDGFFVSNAFGVSSVPSMFLVERDGTVSRVIEGWNRQEIEWLAGLAGAQAVRQGENVPAWKAG